MSSPRPSCFLLISLIGLCWVLGSFALIKEWKDFINNDIYKKYVGKTGQQFNRSFFEGDIDKVDNDASDQEVVMAFNAVKDAKFRWPDATVPFTISASFSNEEQMLIRDAITAITESTNDCVRFVERINEVDYVQIIRGLGCYSSGVGRQGGAQRVSFTIGCLDELGDVQHEILHALGFYHEHTREDRDEYITINWPNIREDNKIQFEKFDGLTFGLPYDYSSVMHYPWNAFAMNPDLPTMVPNQKEAMIGQRINLSLTDIKRIRKAYACDEPDNTIQSGDMEIITTPTTTTEETTTPTTTTEETTTPTTTTEETTTVTTTPMTTTLIPEIMAVVTAAYRGDYRNSDANSKSVNNLRILTSAGNGYVKVGTNDQMSGFIPEFLDILAPLANFTYTLTLQWDGVYGALLSRIYGGHWNGMVGHLIAGSYDVIAADLTLTAARSRVIDFTTPYLATQLRILVNTQWGTKNVTYLVKLSSAYAQFLQTSTNPSIVAIWENIQANNGFVTRTQEGVDKVLAGGFAFIMDIPTLNSALRANPIKLELSPDVLLDQFFAFAVQKGSKWCDPIGIAISEANESGQLQNLLDKYGFKAA